MKRIALMILMVAPLPVWSQFGVDFHQSNLQFIGLNYEIKDRFRPELRFGTDNFLEDVSVELVVMYDVLNTEDYEFYLGLGARGNIYEGAVVPIGVNFYPLATKNFGFHIELTPMLGESSILRGSWGIRYRFGKSNK
jgi:hypothetical protein